MGNSSYGTESVIKYYFLLISISSVLFNNSMYWLLQPPEMEAMGESKEHLIGRLFTVQDKPNSLVWTNDLLQPVFGELPY